MQFTVYLVNKGARLTLLIKFTLFYLYLLAIFSLASYIHIPVN
jgi:hypothetical protein